MRTRKLLWLLCWFISLKSSTSIENIKPQKEGQYINCLIKNYALDLWDFTKGLFSSDTIIVAGIFIPTYFLSRLIDTRVHSHFYCSHHHHNISECHTFDVFCGSDVIFGLLLTGLSLPAFISHNECLRTTSRIFLETIPFLLLAKKLLKKMRVSESVRPFCQWYHKKKTFSGFPSGHLLTLVFTATLFGSQLGPRWAIPFALWSGITFIDFISSNRHYVSQMIAGAGFGLIFGLAASKVVDGYCVCKQNIEITASPTAHGGISCGISYSY